MRRARLCPRSRSRPNGCASGWRSRCGCSSGLDLGARAGRLRPLDVDRAAGCARDRAAARAQPAARPAWRRSSRSPLAIPLGTLAAVNQDTWVDYVVRIFSIAGLAMPSFWLGLAHDPGPAHRSSAGRRRSSFTPFLQDPVANLSSSSGRRWRSATATRPVATRMTRWRVLEVLREDYVRTARAKGSRERAS